MGLTHHPNGISSFGMPVIGGGGRMTTGNVFFVDSGATNASDGNLGASPDKPLATLNGGLTRATASNGDIIFLMPGHAENCSSATTQVIDKAGITVIGIGESDLRPTFTFTATGGSFEMDSANCVVENVKFLSSITAVVVGINVDANGCILRGCQWDWDATGDDFLIHVDADAVDHVTIENCEFISEDCAGAATGVRIDDCEHLRIVGNYFFGDFSAAVINNDSDAAACTDVLVHDNNIYNSDTVATTNGIDFHNACTGTISRNLVNGLNTVAALFINAIDPGSCMCYENYTTEAVDVTAVPVPTTVSAT